MRRFAWIVGGAVGLALGLGCEQVSGLSVRGDRWLEAIDAHDEGVFELCLCDVQNNESETVEHCLWERGGKLVPPPVAKCVAAYIDERPQMQPWVECQWQAHTGLRGCVEQAGCGGAPEACLEAEAEALADCDLPVRLDAEIQATCYGNSPPPPFVCGGGTQVSYPSVCDGYEDCPDGSDEQSCP